MKPPNAPREPSDGWLVMQKLDYNQFCLECSKIRQKLLDDPYPWAAPEVFYKVDKRIVKFTWSSDEETYHWNIVDAEEWQDDYPELQDMNAKDLLHLIKTILDGKEPDEEKVEKIFGVAFPASKVRDKQKLLPDGGE